MSKYPFENFLDGYVNSGEVFLGGQVIAGVASAPKEQVCELFEIDHIAQDNDGELPELLRLLCVHDEALPAAVRYQLNRLMSLSNKPALDAMVVRLRNNRRLDSAAAFED